jgi:hypothetical protein
MEKYLTLEQIEALYPNECVLLANGCISKSRIDDYLTLPSPKERGRRIILKCTLANAQNEGDKITSGYFA